MIVVCATDDLEITRPKMEMRISCFNMSPLIFSDNKNFKCYYLYLNWKQNQQNQNENVSNIFSLQCVLTRLYD